MNRTELVKRVVAEGAKQDEAIRRDQHELALRAKREEDAKLSEEALVYRPVTVSGSSMTMVSGTDK